MLKWKKLKFTDKNKKEKIEKKENKRLYTISSKWGMDWKRVHNDIKNINDWYSDTVVIFINS